MTNLDPVFEGVVSQELSSGSKPTPVTLTYAGKSLNLANGANKIEWQYDLKTQTTSTYGGEVTQILGASVGPFRISGDTASSWQYEKIRKWLVEVMTALGTGQRRNEQGIIFDYPERGWSFEIMPIDFGPWELDNTLVGTEWFLTAEIVSRTPNSLEVWTMGQAGIGMPDSSLLAPHSFDFWRSLFDPSVAPENFQTDEQQTQSGNSLNDVLAHNVAGGLELLGHVVGSDKSADEIYEEFFGSKWLIGPAGESNTSAGADPNSRLGKVSIIADAFSNQSRGAIPAQLGVTVAMIESSDDLNANVINSGGFFGMFQTRSSGRGGGGPNVAQVRAAEAAVAGLGAGSFPAISENYPVSSQAADAADWFNDYRPENTISTSNKSQMLQWAFRAQGITESPSDKAAYERVWNAKWRLAGELIQQAEEAGAAGGTGSAVIAGLPTDFDALKTAILNHARFRGFDGGVSITSDVATVVLQGALAIMNAGWDIHISSLKRNRGNNSLHEAGKAIDLNNYGPTGAANNSGGTSSASATAFIAFLKANRATLRLGPSAIGHGAGSPKSGADFADQDHHVHIQWPR